MNMLRQKPNFVAPACCTTLAVVFTSGLVLCTARPALAQVEEAPAAEPAPPEAPPAEAPAPEPAPEAAAPSEPVPEAAPAPAPEAPADAAADVPAKPKPPKYSIPFQLRPVLAVNVLRSDTSLAFYKTPSAAPVEDSGTTVASMLLFSKKITDSVAPMVRLGIVSNSPPGDAESATNFLNPAVGITWALNPLPPLRIGLFLGLTAPIGSGGGNEAEAKNMLANGAGILARSAMDNAMFAVNYFTVFPGVGIAYVADGFTAQVEATVLQLTRVRGDEFDKDESRTNLTAGVHLGYFVAPFASIGAELRHQRWLSTPQMVENDTTDTLRDNTTVALGPRFHIQLQEKLWLRPAVSLSLPLDDPMKDRSYKVVQLDVPLLF
jgi:hypothetical protein